MECCKKKIRTDGAKCDLANRLKRIEGQIRGISGMVENDAYCVDILTQVSAVRAALTAFSKELLESHIKECVVEDIKNESFEKVDELVAVVERFMR